MNSAMRFVDEFRDPSICRALVEAIRRTCRRTWRIMEICGGQTHGLLEYGIDQELAGAVELIHGPGCPVCVTSAEAIDFAIEMSFKPKTLVATFGDMLRVPGSHQSLRSAQGQGAQVKMVYSPTDAVQLAKLHPDLEVIFFAVGFETTAPATALALLQASQLGLTNFRLLVRHVRVLPGLEAILADEHHVVQGILAAGHVCAVEGFREYEKLVDGYCVPVVITGFEPADLLAGIHECVTQLENAESRVVNQYARHVHKDGNRYARQFVDRVYEPCDVVWRGMGTIPLGGMRLRAEWSMFCAEQRFGRLHRAETLHVLGTTECPSGEVLMGRLKPPACPHFGNRCTPASPLGAPMVSSEGACAAYHRRVTRDGARP